MAYRWLIGKMKKICKGAHAPDRHSQIRVGDYEADVIKNNNNNNKNNKKNSNNDYVYFCKDKGVAKKDSPISKNIPDREKSELKMFVALYDYEAKTEEEISLHEDEIVQMLNAAPSGWCYVQNKREERGYVPRKYIDEHSKIPGFEWYFPGISRTESEDLLYEEGNQVGSYLVRDAVSRNNAYSLTIRCQDKVCHYLVHLFENGYTMNRREVFKSLPILLDFCKQEIAGLRTVLRKPCIKNDRQVIPDSSSLDREICEKTGMPVKLVRLVHFGNAGEKLKEGDIAYYKEPQKPGSLHPVKLISKETVLKGLRSITPTSPYVDTSRAEIVRPRVPQPCLRVSKPAPVWEGTAVIDGQFKELKLEDYRGKYLVFFFYPLDFTFVCPTEILAFNDRVNEFRALNTEVVACSVDSHFTHLAWTNTPRKDGGLGKLNIPLLSDITHKISNDYGVYLEDQGIALRGLFIIDDKGVLRQITMNDLPVGRSVDETLRLVQAFQFTDSHGEVCPAGWKPGDDTIIPNPQEKLKYFSKANQ